MATFFFDITRRIMRVFCVVFLGIFGFLGSATSVLAVSSAGLNISTDGILTGNGNVVLDDASADTIGIGQNGVTPDTVTIAGNVSLTDTQWSISAAGAGSLASLTVSGATALNGSTTLGDAATDAITVTGEVLGASPLSFEGTTNDNIYTIFAITDPTSANKTITFPNSSITVNAAADISGTTLAANVVSSSLTSVGTLTSLTVSGATALNGSTTLGDAATDAVTVTGEILNASPLNFEGTTNDNIYTIFAITDPTSANKTITFPNASGTVVVSASSPLSLSAAGDMSCASCVTLTGTQTLTNKTLTSPSIGTSILDTNGNVLLTLTATGSAVNAITLANAAAGNAPSLTASGSDTNINLNLVPKGTGGITINGGGAIAKFLTTTAVVDFASITLGGCDSKTATVTGAALGDTVVADPTTNDATLNSGTLYGRVTATNTVTLVFCTPTGVDVPSLTYRIDVWQH